MYVAFSEGEDPIAVTAVVVHETGGTLAFELEPADPQSNVPHP